MQVQEGWSPYYKLRGPRYGELTISMAECEGLALVALAKIKKMTKLINGSQRGLRHCLRSQDAWTSTHTILSTSSTPTCHPHVISSDLRPWLQHDSTPTMSVANSMANTSYLGWSNTTRYDSNPYSYFTHSTQRSHHKKADVPSKSNACAATPSHNSHNNGGFQGLGFRVHTPHIQSEHGEYSV